MTSIRPQVPADHDAVFAMMSEPDGVAAAAFTAADPTDRDAFDRHQERIAALDGATQWVVTDDDGTFVGTIATFRSDDDLPEVTYWIRRDRWGQGHASRAIALVLEQTPRPVLARAASDNLGSRRVLEKAGFVEVGHDRGFAAGRGTEVDETLYRLGT